MAETDRLLALYRTMLLVRQAETALTRLFADGEVPGFIHLSIGQEAIAAGVASALGPADTLATTHRGHGHVLARGLGLEPFFKEVMGRAGGICGGRGGSMHVADTSLGILGANGIVGGGMGIATGAAYSADLRGSGQVAVCFFGDGASNQGVLMEVANMAALWKLPIIYLCEANQYAEFSPVAPFLAVERLEWKAQAFGMPGATVDGNDVLAVYEATSRAVARARAGGGPTFLVAQTYRIEGHTVGDPLSYRPQGETEQWKAPDRDPISRFGQRLLVEFGFTAEQLESLRQRARADIDDAIAFAKASPEPEMGSLWEDVYA